MGGGEVQADGSELALRLFVSERVQSLLLVWKMAGSGNELYVILGVPKTASETDIKKVNMRV